MAAPLLGPAPRAQLDFTEWHTYGWRRDVGELRWFVDGVEAPQPWDCKAPTADFIWEYDWWALGPKENGVVNRAEFRGRMVMSPYHAMDFNSVPDDLPPCSLRDNLVEIDRLVNNLYRKQAEQAVRFTPREA